MWAYPNDDVHPLSSHTAPRSGAVGAGLPPAIRRTLSRANPLQWLRTWLRQETAHHELYALDERTLADLGITRGDFPRILEGTFRRGE